MAFSFFHLLLLLFYPHSENTVIAKEFFCSNNKAQRKPKQQTIKTREMLPFFKQSHRPQSRESCVAADCLLLPRKILLRFNLHDRKQTNKQKQIWIPASPERHFLCVPPPCRCRLFGWKRLNFGSYRNNPVFVFSRIELFFLCVFLQFPKASTPPTRVH